MAESGMPADCPASMRFGGLAIDYGARTASLDGQSLSLTRSEFDLLARLTRTPGLVVTNADLLSYIWDEPWMGDETSIETHVSRLRRKLGESASAPRFIWTIRGVGYRFDGGEPQPAEQLSEVEPVDRDGNAARHGHRRRMLLIVAGGLALASLIAFGMIRYLDPPGSPGECAAGYEPCLPVTDDLDCPQIRALVTVTGEDQYGLDRDGDGLGCQLYAPVE